MDYKETNVRLVADTLENRCVSLCEVLEELEMDPNLVTDSSFCCDLDHHILFCTECFYWYNPSLIIESPLTGENICEECA